MYICDSSIGPRCSHARIMCYLHFLFVQDTFDIGPPKVVDMDVLNIKEGQPLHGVAGSSVQLACLFSG
jgi:hypothetical protein